MSRTSLELSTASAARAPWSKSGFQGVYMHRRGKWWWDARWRGKRMCGYGFNTPEEAAKARAKAIKQNWPDRVVMTK